MKKKLATKLITVNIDQVEPNDYNYNEMTTTMLAKEKKSIEKFGVVKPPLVWEPMPGHYIIINGEHRWKCLKKMGIETIPVRNVGKITLKEAKQLTILLDEIRGEPDYTKLTRLFGSFEEISAADISSLLPWNTEEITAMVDSADFDWTEYDFSKDDFRSPAGDYSEIVCRIEEADAALIEEKADTLCEKHGFFDKSAPVKLGMLFEHLLKRIQIHKKE